MAANMQSQLPLDQIGKGGSGAGASLGQGPQPDPLSPADRSFLGYGGQGQPVDWFTAMGMPGGMNTGGQGPGWAGQSATPQPMYGPPSQTASNNSAASMPLAQLPIPAGISSGNSIGSALQSLQGKGGGGAGLS